MRGLVFVLRFLVVLLVAALAEFVALGATGALLEHHQGPSGRMYFTDLSMFGIDSPSLALAQTVPPFCAGLLLGRHGFLIGGLVGGALAGRRTDLLRRSSRD